jgi:hypothetical protein
LFAVAESDVLNNRQGSRIYYDTPLAKVTHLLTGKSSVTEDGNGDTDICISPNHNTQNNTNIEADRSITIRSKRRNNINLLNSNDKKVKVVSE